MGGLLFFLPNVALFGTVRHNGCVPPRAVPHFPQERTMNARFLLAVASLALAASATFAQINPVTAPNGDVTWGPGPHGDPVSEWVPSAPASGGTGYLKFFWTRGATPGGQPIQHEGFAAVEEFNGSGDDRHRNMKRPPTAAGQPAITDWSQEVGSVSNAGEHKTSKVTAGNIAGRSWSFQPLADLDGIFGRIPDLGPSLGNTEPGDLIIYAAVNLGLYLSANPQGFLNGAWGDHQTLQQLNLQIVNGQIPGVQGMYFSETPFIFDPNSATGYVPMGGTWFNSGSWQAQHGDIQILGTHAIPAPGAGGTVLLAGCLIAARRRRTR
jgi:hypothetical protein